MKKKKHSSAKKIQKKKSKQKNKVVKKTPQKISKYNVLRKEIYKYLKGEGQKPTMAELSKISSDLYKKLKIKFKGKDQEKLLLNAIKNADVVIDEYFAPTALIDRVNQERWWLLDELLLEIPASSYVVIDNSSVLSGADELYEGLNYEAKYFVRSTYTELNKLILHGNVYYDYLMVFVRNEKTGKEFVCFILLEETDSLFDSSYDAIVDEINRRIGLSRVFKKIAHGTPSEISIYKVPEVKKPKNVKKLKVKMISPKKKPKKKTTKEKKEDLKIMREYRKQMTALDKRFDKGLITKKKYKELASKIEKKLK